MRRVRFAADGAVREGIALGQGEELRLLDGGGRAFSPAAVVWLAPVRMHSVFGIALNYADHAGELSLAEPEQPALFLKPRQSVIGHGGSIVAPPGVRHMHYEAELAVVIGRAARRVSPQRALEHVAGYTIANDVTVRDFVTNVFRPPTKAKGFDTFCPIGPWLVDGIDDPAGLGVRTYVNGRLVQEGTTSDMVHDVPHLLSYLSEFTTLQPGDVILTGTPKGISPIVPGDRVRIEIDRIGALENPVVVDPGPAEGEEM